MSGRSGRSDVCVPPQSGADISAGAMLLLSVDRGSGRDHARSRVMAIAAFLAAAMAAPCSPALASPADMALRSSAVAGKLAELRQTCSNESIQATPSPVKLTPGATAVLVKFTSSMGQCFGQPGENDYLLVHEASGWRSILAAEPGTIRVGPPGAKGFATVTLYGLGMCRIIYRRAGSAYRATASKECHGMNGSPSLLDVRRAIRD